MEKTPFKLNPYLSVPMAISMGSNFSFSCCLVRHRTKRKKPATVDQRLFWWLLTAFTFRRSLFHFPHSTFDSEGQQSGLLCKWNALKENQLTKANKGRGRTQWPPASYSPLSSHPAVKRCFRVWVWKLIKPHLMQSFSGPNSGVHCQNSNSKQQLGQQQQLGPKSTRVWNSCRRIFTGNGDVTLCVWVCACVCACVCVRVCRYVYGMTVICFMHTPRKYSWLQLTRTIMIDLWPLPLLWAMAISVGQLYGRCDKSYYPRIPRQLRVWVAR